MFTLKLILILLVLGVRSYQVENAETVCAQQCVCMEEHISDLPMMKWFSISLSGDLKQNESVTDNTVLQDNEEKISLDSNPLIRAAYCAIQEDSHQIMRDDFFSDIEALTILYGRDMLNKTIEYELSEFRDLLALDIQGYNKNVNATDDYIELSLQHNALLQLQKLRYLNVEYVLLSANPNSITEEPSIDTSNLLTYNQLEQRKYEIEERHSNITILIWNEPKIIPYNDYKKQKTFVTTFSHLSNLRFLRLFRCHLETLTWEMFKDLSNLHTLSLEGNAIIEIPKLAFYSMPNLKTLILSNNKLMHMYLESLAGLFQLEHLDLSRNNFHHISDSTFAPLPKLQHLDLRDNPLETIYSNTFEVMNVTNRLIIRSTAPLTIHKNTFNGMSCLEKLIIVGLHVENLDKSLLAGMPKLKHLKIEGNIEYIDFDTFTNSMELEVLELKNCSLKFISIDAFYGLFDLKSLDLSGNELESLPPGVFSHLESLNELILRNNKFVTLTDVLHELQHVKMIRLEDNPWNCSCDMAQWRLLNINKVKEARTVDVPCNYKYNKSPCISTEVEVFVYSTKVLPRCATPLEYKGENVFHVVNKKLRCGAQNKKSTYEKYSQPELIKKGRNFEKNERKHVTEYLRATSRTQFSTTQHEYLSVSTRVSTSSETYIDDKFEDVHKKEPKKVVEDVNNELNDLSQFVNNQDSVREKYEEQNNRLDF